MFGFLVYYYELFRDVEIDYHLHVFLSCLFAPCFVDFEGLFWWCKSFENTQYIVLCLAHFTDMIRRIRSIVYQPTVTFVSHFVINIHSFSCLHWILEMPTSFWNLLILCTIWQAASLKILKQEFFYRTKAIYSTYCEKSWILNYTWFWQEILIFVCKFFCIMSIFNCSKVIMRFKYKCLHWLSKHSV